MKPLSIRAARQRIAFATRIACLRTGYFADQKGPIEDGKRSQKGH